MSEVNFDEMSLLELRDYKQKLSQKIADVNNRISVRKRYIKNARCPGNELSEKTDHELLALKQELLKLSYEMSDFKEYKRIRDQRAAVEQEKANLEMQELQIEKMRFEAENAKFITARNMKADERRPDKPRVWFGGEFNNIKGAEKRLIMMMAREIGQERYQELKRIAYWDEQRQNNRYYTGSSKFNNGRGGC